MKYLLIVVALLTAACKAKEGGGGAAGSGAPAQAPGSAAVAETDPGEALGAKANPYIVCLNSFTGDVHHGQQIWMESFAKGPSPAQAKTTLYGPLELNDLKECRDGVAAAKSKAPSMPELEAAGAAYVAALEVLAPLCKDLHEYFQAGNYKDDKLAHAIELHPKLMAAYDAFDKADEALETQIDTLEDKIQAQELAAAEKREGKKLAYFHTAFLISAKRVIRMVGKVETPFEIDLAPYTEAVTAADKALADVTAYYDAHKDEVDKDGMSYWTFVNPAKDFVKNAKDLMRRKRDNEKFSSGEMMTIEANNAESVTGHPRAVGRAYSSLIETANRLRW